MIFHGPQIKMDALLLGNKNPNRLNIFYSRESPGGKPIPTRNVPKDFFNVTLTFRTDSTIYKPYDRFEKIQRNEKANSTFVWTDEQVSS